MADSENLRLIQLLYLRTKERAVQWTPDTTAGAFVASFQDYAIRIRAQADMDFPDQPDYFVEILDEAGRAVDNLSNYSFSTMMEEKTQEGLNPYQVLAETYVAAKRQALGADQALKSLLEQLS